MRKMTHGYTGNLSTTKIAVAPLRSALSILNRRHVTHQPHGCITGAQRAHLLKNMEFIRIFLCNVIK